MHTDVDRINAQLTGMQLVPRGDLAITRPVVVVGETGEVVIVQAGADVLALTLCSAEAGAVTVELPIRTACQFAEALFDLVDDELPAAGDGVIARLRRAYLRECAVANELRAEVVRLKTRENDDA